MREIAVRRDVPYYTTTDGAQAVIGAIEVLLKGESHVQSLQEHHRATNPLAKAA